MAKKLFNEIKLYLLSTGSNVTFNIAHQVLWNRTYKGQVEKPYNNVETITLDEPIDEYERFTAITNYSESPDRVTGSLNILEKIASEVVKAGALGAVLLGPLEYDFENERTTTAHYILLPNEI